MGQLPIVIVQPLEFVALLLWLWLGMKIFAGNAMVSGFEAFPYRLEARVRTITQYVVDAVGSWQIILPMPNLGRPY